MTLTLDVKGVKGEELRKALKPALEILRSGGLAVYPTDTVYGLGCNPLDEAALRRLLEVKGRVGKPLPLLTSSLADARRIAHFSHLALRLAEAFWPGPLTMVLPLGVELPAQVTMGLSKVGVRVPDSDVARLLAEGLGGIIVGTSANRSGEPPFKSFSDVYRWAAGRVDVVIDGGDCRYGLPSTVVEVEGDRVKLLRRGALEPSRIVEVCGYIE